MMNRAIKDIYFIMFRPMNEQAPNMSAKRDCVRMFGDLFRKHKIGDAADIQELEESENLFDYIILTFGDTNGIRKRFIESGS